MRPIVDTHHRSPWQILCSVQLALLVRELKTRFGHSRLGYTWAILEPASHVILMSAVVGFHSKRIMPGIDYPVFVLTGLVAYDLVVRVMVLASTAIEANEGLMLYRQVRPSSLIIARVVLEVLVHVIAFVVLLAAAAFLGFQTMPHDLLGVLLLTFLLVAFTLGLGFIFAILGHLLPETRKSVPVVARFMYFICCIIYPLALIPEAYRPWLTWNPLVHYLELYRMTWFASYPDGGASWTIAMLSAIASLATGAFLYQRYRHRLAATG